jgi:hypothetical protein
MEPWTLPLLAMYLEITGKACGPFEAEQCGHGHAAPVETPPAAAVAGKGMVTMFDDDDDTRVETARRLAEGGSPAAAEAFRAIAVDDGVDDTVRLEAARGLAELGPRSAGIQ